MKGCRRSGVIKNYAGNLRSLRIVCGISTIAFITCTAGGCGDYKPPKFGDIVDSVTGKEGEKTEAEPAAQAPPKESAIAPGSVPVNVGTGKKAGPPAAPAEVHPDPVVSHSPEQAMKQLEEEKFKVKGDQALATLLANLGEHADLVTKLDLEIIGPGMDLLPKFPKLVDLTLKGAAFPTENWQPLGKLVQLERLDLYMSRIDDQGMAFLRPLIHLKELNLYGTSLVTDVGHYNLEQMHELEILNIANNKTINGGGFLHCRQKKSLENLRELYATGTQFGATGMLGIEGLAGLEVLEVSNAGVQNTGLRSFRYCKGIKRLILGQNQGINDLGMSELVVLKKLEYLSLRNLTLVTTDGLGYVKGAKNLEFVSVQGTRVHPDGIRLLKKAIPKVKIEHNDGTVE